MIFTLQYRIYIWSIKVKALCKCTLHIWSTIVVINCYDPNRISHPMKLWMNDMSWGPPNGLTWFWHLHVCHFVSMMPREVVICAHYMYIIIHISTIFNFLDMVIHILVECSWFQHLHIILGHCYPKVGEMFTISNIHMWCGLGVFTNNFP